MITSLRRFLRHVYRRVSHRLDPTLVLLLGLSTFALLPLLVGGYFFEAHDGRHSVFYVTMFDEAVRDGALWPRWAMHHNQGYGYPTFVVQAPLAFYVAEIFVLLGAGITTAVKIGWALGFYAGAWGMYALVRHWLSSGGDPPAAEDGAEFAPHHWPVAPLMAGLLYVYVPYHLLDIYVRAAYAETMLMAWFPWTVLAFDRLIGLSRRPGWGARLLGASLAFAATLLTHVLALPAFAPLLVGFVLFRLLGVWAGNRKNGQRRGAFWSTAGLAIAAGLAGVLVATIFLAPLLVEGPLLDQEVFTGNTYDFSRHFIYWGQFFSPFWGYGFSDDPTGVNDGMGFQVGLLPLTLALLAGWGVAQTSDRRTGRWLRIFLLAASLAVLFTTTPGADFIWQGVKLLEVVQFPWRLLALVAFTLSALGGLVVADWQHNAPGEEHAALVLALLVVLAGIDMAAPKGYQPIDPWREDGRAVYRFEEEHPDMLGYTRWVQEPFIRSPLSPGYEQESFSYSGLERLGIARGRGRVLSNISRGHTFGGVVQMETDGAVEIRVYYFPGWRVTVDGEPAEVSVSQPRGLLTVDVPAGEHVVRARMGLTFVRIVGIALSSGTLLGLLGLAFWENRRSKSAATSRIST